MRVRWPILAALLTIGLSYAAYPYITLYRISCAIRSGDTQTLETLVDWPSVREGIKEDICDLVVDDPGNKSDGTLPPFGAGFMRGIASTAIDQAVTPQALLAVTESQPVAPESRPRGADVAVNWAFFESPTKFVVSLHPAGQSAPIKLELHLRKAAWQVDRIWLPPELLSNRGAKT